MQELNFVASQVYSAGAMSSVFISLILSCLRTRITLQAEVVALRHQLLVLERSHRNVRPACESQTGSFGSGSASLAWLALGSADCEARDCDRLAPPRFSTVLKCGCLGPFNPTCLRPRRKENHFATSSRLSTLQDQDIVALGVVDYSPFRSARTVRLGVNNSVFANCIRHG